MKIAFISYEYPPDTALGGIATYVQQAAWMLTERGHQVEVFTAGLQSQTVADRGALVHRIVSQREEFSAAIAPLFAARHQIVQFDVLEGPDCGADAADAVRLVPDIPLVIKLHTPSYILGELADPTQDWKVRTRMALGALRRGKLPPGRRRYNPQQDRECLHALQADEIASPSLAIGSKVARDWNLEMSQIAHVPYPYVPSTALTSIPIDLQTQTVTFLGRLEIRKGILDLAQAIPTILKQHPEVKFRFVGPAWNSPDPKLDMQQYLEQKLRSYRQSLEFTGRVPLSEIPRFLATDICVFPSIWESFGLVCAEAMSAGRGIVASQSGGMAELLNQGETGLLVPPRNPQHIARAVLHLLNHPQKRMELGQKARERVLTEYSLERISQLQELSYQRAVQRRQALGARTMVGEQSRQLETIFGTAKSRDEFPSSPTLLPQEKGARTLVPSPFGRGLG